MIWATVLYVTPAMIEDAKFDVATFAAETLRQRLRYDIALEGRTMMESSFHIERVFIDETYVEEASGWRRIAERLRLVRPRTFDLQFVAYRATAIDEEPPRPEGITFAD